MSKRKTLVYSGILILGLLTVSGCSNEIPEMTEEEHTLVVNYAADIVQKYNKNGGYKLVEVLPEEKEEPVPDEIEPMQELEEKKEPEVVATPEPVETLDSLLGIDGFTFAYEGLELAEAYPHDGEELYFSMSATSGTQLLVLKFSAENQSELEQTLNMADSGIRFKLIINGKSKNALTTLLVNDFSNVQETVAPGQKIEVVLVCEVPEEEAVDSVAVRIRNADTNGTISLQ